MRIAITAAAATVIGLLAAGVLGVAGADTTPAPVPAAQPRTVSVQGVASAPIAAEANAEAANAAYRQAMAAAIADGQSKAQFLAEKTSATLGPVQNVAEGGGYIQCPGEEEYQGAQPDFGEGSSVIMAPAARELRSAAGVAPRHAKAKHRKPKSAKKSTVADCAVWTHLALSYQLN